MSGITVSRDNESEVFGGTGGSQAGLDHAPEKLGTPAGVLWRLDNDTVTRKHSREEGVEDVV